MAIHPQLPNAITIVRILCAPVFCWLLLADDGRGQEAGQRGGEDGPAEQLHRGGFRKRMIGRRCASDMRVMCRERAETPQCGRLKFGISLALR